MKQRAHNKLARTFSDEQSEVLAGILDEITVSGDYVDAQIAKSALNTTRWVGTVVLAVFGFLLAILLRVFGGI